MTSEQKFLFAKDLTLQFVSRRRITDIKQFTEAAYETYNQIIDGINLIESSKHEPRQGTVGTGINPASVLGYPGDPSQLLK